MIGGIRFEHTHRLIASSVGALTLILTIWIGRTEPRVWVRRLSIAALGAVVLQGILGGLTVLYQLPAPVSIAHACLGPIFFSLVAVLAAVHSPNWMKKKKGAGLLLPLICTPAVFLQLIFGAVVRHTHAIIGVHVAWAFVVLVLAGALVRQSFTRGTALFGFLVILEFFLGIGAFVFTRVIPQGWGEIISPTLHQTIGAAILAMAVVITLQNVKCEQA